MNHPSLVSALCKDGQEIKDTLTALDCHLLHMLIGLQGEVGELTDAIKKAIIYRKPIDLENVNEELGDIEFYLEGLRQALNTTREITLHLNIEKLTKRYGEKYSDRLAALRLDKQSNT